MRKKEEGRSTGYGAYTQARIFDMAGTEVKIARTESSKTGKHWTDFWALDTAQNYFIVYKDISNSGKHHCCVHTLYYESFFTFSLHEHNKLKNVLEFTEIPNIILKHVCPCVLK